MPLTRLSAMTDDDHARDKLKALGERIRQEREAAGLEKPAETSTNQAMGEGFRVATELVVSVFVGAGLGFLAGRPFGQQGIGAVLGLMFGFAAGMRAVYRFMMESAAASEAAGKEDATDDERDDD
ncbi:MAG: AtpZ/AtpI family protein [Parvularcula sp.]